MVPGFPLAWEHPNGGWIVLDERADDERRVLVYRIGRLLEGTNGTDGSDGDDGVDAEIHWPEEATSWEARWVYVVDGSIFTSDDTTLTLRDADLQVVRRYWAPGDRFHLGVVGPWFGAFEYRPMRAEEDWWDEDDRPGTYRLFDPASTGPELDVVFEIPVKSSEVRVRWIDDELWLSDARLRVFRVVGAA